MRAIEASPEGEEAPVVPAGTWASASESESLPPEEVETKPAPRGGRAKEDTPVRLDEPRARPRPVGSGGSLQAGAPRPVAVVADAAIRRGAGARARNLALVTAEKPEPPPELRREAQVVAFPGPLAHSGAASASNLRVTATATTSGVRTQAPVVPTAPPRWLASELLREELPAEPYGALTRVLASALGVVGAAGAFALAPLHELHLGIAVLFASIAVVALTPLPFRLRAGGVAVLAALGVVTSVWSRASVEGDSVALVALGATVLAAGQLSRAVDRRSRFARAVMAVGLLVLVSWLAVSGGFDAMVVRDFTIEAIAPPVVRAVFLVVLALSLLGFADQTGDSGCSVWPWLVLGWSALEPIAALLTGDTPVVAAVSTPLFAVPAALGATQFWLTTPGLRQRTA